MNPGIGHSRCNYYDFCIKYMGLSECLPFGRVTPENLIQGQLGILANFDPNSCLSNPFSVD
jgi:hypothetical protein